jgi:hypothetical protein
LAPSCNIVVVGAKPPAGRLTGRQVANAGNRFGHDALAGNVVSHQILQRYVPLFFVFRFVYMVFQL